MNNIIGIFCKHCKNIIYSRDTHDYVTCDCEKVSVDGGFSYRRIIGDIENFIEVEFDNAKFIKFIMHYDYHYGNKNANNFPDGYYGKFKISNKSNKAFYKNIVINFKDIEEYF